MKRLCLTLGLALMPLIASAQTEVAAGVSVEWAQGDYGRWTFIRAGRSSWLGR